MWPKPGALVAAAAVFAARAAGEGAALAATGCPVAPGAYDWTDVGFGSCRTASGEVPAMYPTNVTSFDDCKGRRVDDSNCVAITYDHASPICQIFNGAVVTKGDGAHAKTCYVLTRVASTSGGTAPCSGVDSRRITIRTGLGAPASRLPLEAIVLVFETDAITPVADLGYAQAYVAQLDEHRVPFRIIGAGDTYLGWGHKWHALRQVLDRIPPSTVVVVSDSRDVLLNAGPAPVVRRLVDAFEALVARAPRGAVVASAEGRCCVASLTNVKPGGLFAPDGSRAARACSSGRPSCPWVRSGRPAWQTFMSALAAERGFEGIEVFLNAGLLAGRANDLLQLVQNMSIAPEEDDQAVLSDLLHHRPDMIVLDYSQTLFGNSRYWASLEDGGCPYAPSSSKAEVEHLEYQTRPVFIHAAAHFQACLDRIAASLGVTTSASSRLLSSGGYGYGYGYGDGADDETTTASETHAYEIEADFIADLTLADDVTDEDLMASDTLITAKEEGLAAALNIQQNTVAVTNIALFGRRLYSGNRQLTATVSVETTFTVSVADEAAGNALAATIVDAAADIHDEINSALSAADWANESKIRNPPLMSGHPQMGTPKVRQRGETDRDDANDIEDTASYARRGTGVLALAAGALVVAAAAL